MAGMIDCVFSPDAAAEPLRPESGQGWSGPGCGAAEPPGA